MTILPIDELNTMSEKPEDYFGEMLLTEVQKEERIEFTKKANEVFLEIMTLICAMADYGSIDYPYVMTELERQLTDLILNFVAVDTYLEWYIRDTAENFVDATQRNIGDVWYISEDRALFNAENDANDVLNYGDYLNAVEAGYARKKWVTERDLRVRKTHSKVEGKTLGITEYFVVGDALMRFPKDYELAEGFPEETINCRCSIKYLR